MFKRHLAQYFSILILLFLSVSSISSCKKDKNKDKVPLAFVNITIDPNSTIYQQLNIIGGWMYLDETDGVNSPSRGIIVYRASTDQFMAYERTPPYKPDSCCTSANTNCSKLVVDSYFPFVMDTCTGSKYLILDGTPVESPSPVMLGIYYTEYYGQLLYIHN
jgi:hypothetical protein